MAAGGGAGAASGTKRKKKKLPRRGYVENEAFVLDDEDKTKELQFAATADMSEDTLELAVAFLAMGWLNE